MGQPDAPVLRPLTIADILDQAIRLYRQNFALFLGIIALVYVPMGVVTAYLMYLYGTMTAGMPDDPTQMDINYALLTLMPILVVLVVYLLGQPIAQGALAVAISRRYLGQETSVTNAYTVIGTRWLSLLAAAFVVAVLSLFGFSCCVAPGVYLYVMLLFTSSAIAIEAVGPVDGMSRSWWLVSGEFWRCFGTLALLYVLVMVATYAIVIPLTALALPLIMNGELPLGQAVTHGITSMVGMLFEPLTVTTVVLLYYDLRVRKEGFDLQLLAQSLAGTAPKPGTAYPVGSGPLVTGYEKAPEQPYFPAAPPPPAEGVQPAPEAYQPLIAPPAPLPEDEPQAAPEPPYAAPDTPALIPQEKPPEETDEA